MFKINTNYLKFFLQKFSKKISLLFRIIFRNKSNQDDNLNFAKTKFSDDKNHFNPIIWIAFFFACGCIFYIKFSENFVKEIIIFIGFFIIALILFLADIFNKKSAIYLFVISFLLGSFYNYFYEKTFLNYSKITEKIYTKNEGKIIAIKKFNNPINNQNGINLIIENPIISKMNPSDSIYKTKAKSLSKKSKKNKSKKKKNKKKTKKKTNKKNLGENLGENSEKTKGKNSARKSKKSNSTNKKSKKKNHNFNKISKTKFKNLVNLKDYQEIDRVFLDYQKNYQNYHWLKVKDNLQLAKPPPHISVNLTNNFYDLKINDKIRFFSLLQPSKSKDFLDDFDHQIDGKLKKLSGYGYVIGDIEIIEHSPKITHEDFLRNLRQIIGKKILNILPNNEGGIALALLIGDQSNISSELLQKIRNCGLSHLLSISGFHLSLASLIFFMLFRFILSHFPAIALRYDLKKISAIFALMASYFYLKIAGTPIPAQRAFLMVLLLQLSYFISERFNSKRALMLSFFILTLFNPYLLFNLSFQLSFIAIMIMICYYHDYVLKKTNQEITLEGIQEKKFFFNRLVRFIAKIYHYLKEIIVISTIIQIATLPFLMNAFHNFSLIAPISNIFAIPLTSFVIMPLGFLSLFLMIFNLENYGLLTMKWGILFLQKIIIFFSDFNFSYFTTPHLPQISLALSSIAIFLFCLENHKKLKFIAGIIFISSFLIGSFIAKPILAFGDNQKFYALYHPETGLRFSKEIRISKRQKNWLFNFNEKKFKVIDNCDFSTGINNFCQQCTKTVNSDYCIIFYDNHQILAINQRSKINDLCDLLNKNSLDLIVNLTSKYQLPQCFLKSNSPFKIIDNFNFLESKTHLIYLKNNQLEVKNPK